MKNNNAFRRARVMMAKIQYIMTQTSSPILANLLIGQLGAYKSRGHGGGHTPKAKYGFAFTENKKSRSKYQPHQGEREITRRIVQADHA